MAYTPDDAISRRGEVSRSTWDVYAQLCAFGDPETGIVEARFAANARLAKFTVLKLGTVKNAMTTLRHKGWIEERGGLIYLRVGTFLRELREQRKKASKPSLPNDTPSLVSDTPSLHSDAPSLPNDAPSLVSDGAYIDARAVDQTVNQSVDQTENQLTHTRLGAGAPSDEPPAAACVSVAERPSFERLKRFARNQSPPLGRGWLDTALTAEGLKLTAIIVQVEDWEREQEVIPVANGSRAPCLSCSDCDGTTGRGASGRVYVDPSNPGRGMRKCEHPGLNSARAGPKGERMVHAGQT
ncbi:MAG TPA: hypothetical protein VF735_08935 [Pyrinomonadaceae bacterium]|jgi:hypothetical protein